MSLKRDIIKLMGAVITLIMCALLIAEENKKRKPIKIIPPQSKREALNNLSRYEVFSDRKLLNGKRNYILTEED